MKEMDDRITQRTAEEQKRLAELDAELDGFLPGNQKH